MGKKTVILDQAASWSRSSLTSTSGPRYPNFLSVIWRYCDDSSRVFASRLVARQLGQFHEDELEVVRFPIPAEDYQPPWDSSIWRFASSDAVLDSYIYVKRPRLVGYDGSPGIARKVRQEIDILEKLRVNPHANLCEYYGCQVDDKRSLITGVCLKRYYCTLGAYLDPRNRDKLKLPFNVDAVVSGITSAISHLHSLGLAHNDLNPSNIMLDRDGTPVIIDFNNCAPFGQPCRSGTPGFTNYATISDVRNDMYGYSAILHKIYNAFGSQLGDHTAFHHMPLVYNHSSYHDQYHEQHVPPVLC